MFDETKAIAKPSFTKHLNPCYKR